MRKGGLNLASTLYCYVGPKDEIREYGKRVLGFRDWNAKQIRAHSPTLKATMSYSDQRTLCLGLVIACLFSGHALADAVPKAVTVSPLASTNKTASGQPITLPAGRTTVSVSRYIIAPGATLPVHKHPYPRYAYVQAGHLAVYAADTGQRYDYKAGDFIVEILDGWHYGENTGAEPVELLVIDQMPEGRTTNTVLKP